MNTATHLIVASAALMRPGKTKENWAIAVGAVAADLSMFVFFAWATFLTDMDQQQIWDIAYWQEPWQTFSALSNSLPIALAPLALSTWRKWPILTAFSLALIVHFFLDFPVHADDAHRHFWPLTDWRFQSPFSYWDENHHAGVVFPIEYGLFAVSTLLLWRRFSAVWTRILLALALFLMTAGGLAVLFLR